MADSRQQRQRSEPENPRGAQDGLRVAVRNLIATALSGGAEQALEAALSEVCTMARNDGRTVEHLLIVLRAEWDSARKPSGLRPDALEAIRSRLASHCIEKFYGA